MQIDPIDAGGTAARIESECIVAEIDQRIVDAGGIDRSPCAECRATSRHGIANVDLRGEGGHGKIAAIIQVNRLILS